jgi:hypothetical protein
MCLTEKKPCRARHFRTQWRESGRFGRFASHASSIAVERRTSTRNAAMSPISAGRMLPGGPP